MTDVALLQFEVVRNIAGSLIGFAVLVCLLVVSTSRQ